MTRRFPWLTLVVFVLTSAVTAAMAIWPGLGPALERDPAMLQGEWWRFVTTWLVLTDGPVQVVVNSIGLLAYGTLAELALGPAWWAAAYVVAGLVGEIAGLFWQPVGGGNSVAICGLIGLFSLWQLAQRQPALPLRALGTVVWGGLGLWLFSHTDIHGAALLAGFAMGALWWGVSRRRAAP